MPKSRQRSKNALPVPSPTCSPPLFHSQATPTAHPRCTRGNQLAAPAENFWSVHPGHHVGELGPGSAHLGIELCRDSRSLSRLRVLGSHPAQTKRDVPSKRAELGCPGYG